jgi:hypothetical protein
MPPQFAKHLQGAVQKEPYLFAGEEIFTTQFRGAVRTGFSGPTFPPEQCLGDLG